MLVSIDDNDIPITQSMRRAVTKALIGGGGGVHIHIFAFCPTNFF